MKELNECPWKSSRWSPRRKTLTMLNCYIESQGKPESILEVGGGVSKHLVSKSTGF